MAAHFLGKWTPRDTAQQLQRLARHTAMVGVSKYLLVGGAIILVALVFLLPALHKQNANLIPLSAIPEGEAEQPRMKNPQFQSVDRKNQPFRVTADMAEQQEDGRVRLKNLQADISLSDGSWLAFIASVGFYHPEHNTLELPEEVQLFHNVGYELRTRSVFVSLKEGVAYGYQPVEGQGPAGTLKSEGFHLDNGKGRLMFMPNVTVVLQPDANRKQQ